MKVFQESIGRISRDMAASFSGCPLSDLGACQERPRGIASLLSIVGQHCLCLDEIMQRSPMSIKLCSPFKENNPSHRFACSFAEFIAQPVLQIMTMAGAASTGLVGMLTAREGKELTKF